MLQVTWPRAPVGQGDQNGSEREQLAHLHTRVETDDVLDEPVWRQVELLQLRRQAKAVEQAEDQHRDPGVGLKAEGAETAHVLESFVDDGQADDRVDEIR